VWRWRVVIGLASACQIAAGLTFFALTPVREAAPFGLALCAGVGLLSMASQATAALVRVAVGANILLALLTALGVVPLVIALVAGAAPSWLAGYAVGNTALTAASVGSAVGLRRLWP
jgi:hypothetical protein